jgi:hypothetical protein
MKTSETTAEVFTALAKAAAELENPRASETAKVKSKKTGVEFSYKYANLADLAAQIRTCLSAHGLAVLQEAVATLPANTLVGVNTRIVHSSGEWVELGTLWMQGGEGAQEQGSALTYARRYALTAAFTLAPDEDDDGAKAQAAKKSGGGKAPSTPGPSTGKAGADGHDEQPPLDATVDSGHGTQGEPAANAPLGAPETPAVPPLCPKCGGLMLSGEQHHPGGPTNRWICSKCNTAIKKEAADAATV